MDDMEDYTMRNTGVIKKTLPDLKFTVLLEDGREVTAYPSGKVRHFAGKILLGDKVKIESFHHDLTLGRIVRINNAKRKV